jgi:2-methylcitrate dehydratase PrpD
MDHIVAKHVTQTQFDAIDPESVQATKHHVLHTLVCAVAGSNAPGIAPLHELARESGAGGQSTVLAHGTRLNAMYAAMVNSSMAHAQDFDMNDDRTFYKSSVTAVPAALALAEEIGRIDGKEFLTAVCTGIDLGIRIGLAVMPKPAHARSQMVGGFAAVATAGRLLKLDCEQMLDALGIVYCQVAASGSSNDSPALTKRLAPGLASRAGIFSARLGQKGFKAGRNVLSGRKGFFWQYHGHEGDLDTITSGLGQRWELVNVGPKGYPCCRVLHAPIDAALAAVREHAIVPDEVENVIVRGSASNIFISTGEKPPASFEKYRHPIGVVDAQFSVHWGVAAAIARGDVFIDCFTEDAIKDPVINRLTDRIEVVADPSLDPTLDLLAPAIVEIKTRRGTFSKRVEFAKGNPKNPVTWAETERAFHRSAAFAARPIGRDSIDRAISLIANLENVGDVSELASVLGGERQQQEKLARAV